MKAPIRQRQLGLFFAQTPSARCNCTVQLFKKTTNRRGGKARACQSYYCLPVSEERSVRVKDGHHQVSILLRRIRVDAQLKNRGEGL